MNRPIALPILAFLITSAVASPLLAKLQEPLGIDPDVLRLTVFSTVAGALLVWLAWGKRLSYPPVGEVGLGKSLLVAASACLLATCIALALAKVEGAPWRPPTVEALKAPLALVLIVQLLGAAAEEMGWRGLVQPLLETKFTPWIAALVTGVLFGLGHFYLAFELTPLAFALFVFSAVAMSVILALATVGRSLWNRIAIATALHYLLNMATWFLFADGDGSVLYFTNLAVGFGFGGGLALIFLARRHRLFPLPSAHAPSGR